MGVHLCSGELAAGHNARLVLIDVRHLTESQEIVMLYAGLHLKLGNRSDYISLQIHSKGASGERELNHNV